ncbi:hypothetical protein LTR72_010904 [Exophiala xenobiotica]|nr:hypothetical protein LTR72_010904 [Exophiala xenobiotica]KAK5244127.1 hypothetical protein LTS06_010249 [Exophiala xenobiotica]KAK5261001.1 hypothetical protein LTR40_003067 [Exophiala xenobiotica]KAK5285519.1 hypothetical protein LTR14_010915 [Exophiala xenobiotica]KAK5367122.1 hypothetical protein LTS13_007975 [Exophiala xenobiotica]
MESLDLERARSTKADAVMSKQQRVRDNQRRSRARRQEYIAELENQLQQCHITCREADLQRSAFAELQAENARMRDLLKDAGISPDNMESFDRESTLQRPGGLITASFRHLKPKLSVPMVANPSSGASQKPSSAAYCSTPSPSSCWTPQPAMTTENFATYNPQYSYQLMAPPTVPTTTMSIKGVATGYLTTSYEWYFPPHGQETRPPSDPYFKERAVELTDKFCFESSTRCASIKSLKNRSIQPQERRGRLVTGYKS